MRSNHISYSTDFAYPTRQLDKIFSVFSYRTGLFLPHKRQEYSTVPRRRRKRFLHISHHYQILFLFTSTINSRYGDQKENVRANGPTPGLTVSHQTQQNIIYNFYCRIHVKTKNIKLDRFQISHKQPCNKTLKTSIDQSRPVSVFLHTTQPTFFFLVIPNQQLLKH